MSNVNTDMYDIEIKSYNKVVAHMGCSVVKDTVNVKDLWVRKLFRNKGIEELLMEKLIAFARDKKAHYIVTYCGPEPMNPDGNIPIETEIKFYENHGFKLDHYVFDIVPCMIKTM